MSTKGLVGLGKAVVSRLMMAVGAVGITLALFMVLPLMQAISKPPEKQLTASVNAVIQEEEQEEVKKEEPKEEQKEPEVQEINVETEAPPEPPMNLAALTGAMMGSGGGTGSLGAQVPLPGSMIIGDGGMGNLNDMAGLDQKPRAIHKASPTLTPEIRRRAPGYVKVLLQVDKNGRVTFTKAVQSSDPVFEKSALAAVRQWKFEPGKRNGKPSEFYLKVDVQFPQGL